MRGLLIFFLLIANEVLAVTTLRCGRFTLELRRPLIMGIVNLTDDSFSGDGWAGNAQCAIEHGLRLVEQGANILDIGGESSRPGAQAVPAQQELERVLPVVQGLLACGVPLSVDTAKTEVMHAALAVGVDMINDIAALQAQGALETVAASQAAVCLMHMQGEPRTMQQSPQYGEVVSEVLQFLAARVASAEAAGIARGRIVLDPGFCFGKTLAHNLSLLRHFSDFKRLGLPLLAGLSRKSMLGQLIGPRKGVVAHERLAAGIAAHVLLLQNGANIVRVHDVAEIRDAMCVLNAVEDVFSEP